jgi:hypothetical protein
MQEHNQDVSKHTRGGKHEPVIHHAISIIAVTASHDVI